MPNTIQLKLLENKTIVAEINGRNYAYEGGYNIVAGEENATEFEVVNVPVQYKDFFISIALTNSRGQQVKPPEIINNKFMLPVGMAVAGYGQLIVFLHGYNEQGDTVTVPFLPFKIKVANTKANWTDGVISGTISIGKVETLAPGQAAYAVNVGTANDARINFGIPQGKRGDDALPIKIVGETYYDPALTYNWSTAELLPLPLLNNTEEGTAYLVDDNKIKGQYDLYIHNHDASEWVVINNWGGIPGQQGEQGVGITSIEPSDVDENSDNIYSVILSNGEKYEIVAPRGAIGKTGATGATGNGIMSTTIFYATSTSGTTAPTTGWQSTIPTVAQGSYLWTRTVITYTNGTTSTSYTSAYQGVDGTGNVTGVKGNAESTYRTGNVNITPANVGAVNKAGDTMTGILTVPRLDSNTIATRSADYLEIILSTGTVFGITGGTGTVYNLRSMRNDIANAYSATNRPKAALYGQDEDWPYTDEINQVDTVERYFLSSDGNTWYRVWSSGWKECGGIATTSGDSTVAMPITFASIGYVVLLTFNNMTNTETMYMKNVSAFNKTVNSFDIRGSGISNERCWYACGF